MTMSGKLRAEPLIIVGFGNPTYTLFEKNITAQYQVEGYKV
jgi:hypothetical protein